MPVLDISPSHWHHIHAILQLAVVSFQQRVTSTRSPHQQSSDVHRGKTTYMLTVPLVLMMVLSLHPKYRHEILILMIYWSVRHHQVEFSWILLAKHAFFHRTLVYFSPPFWHTLHDRLRKFRPIMMLIFWISLPMILPTRQLRDVEWHKSVSRMLTDALVGRIGR